MSTPRHLFKISHRNYIVRKFVESWQHGAVHWDEMLLDLANFLEKRCNDLVDENEMRSHLILSGKFPSLPFPVLETSLVPDLSGLKHPLERQSELISAIVQIEYIYQNLFKAVERKLDYTSSPTFIRAIAPMESGILNEISKLPQNILDEVGEFTSEDLNYLINASENFSDKTAIISTEFISQDSQQLENDKNQ